MTEFVLQDSRANTGDRLVFWASHAAGYTTNLDEAQRYTKEQASEQNECRESDLPWPLAYLMNRHTLAIDCQYVKQDEIDSQMDGTEPVYLYVYRAWNGNDLIWLANDGRHTDNLVDAKTFEGGGVSAPPSGFVAIPKAIADKLARKVVASGTVNHKEALRGTGIMLAKPPKYRAIRARCYHCGVFLSDAQRFDDCPKCSGSNAP